VDLTAVPGFNNATDLFAEDPEHVYIMNVVFFYDNYFVTFNKNGRVSASYVTHAI